MQLVNLARVADCDVIIAQELNLVGDVNISDVRRGNTEVPYSKIGELFGWKFERAWRYWIVTRVGRGLSSEIASELNIIHRMSVRVNGHSLGETVRDSKSVNLYHVDTLVGLYALVQAIKKQNESDPYDDSYETLHRALTEVVELAKKYDNSSAASTFSSAIKSIEILMLSHDFNRFEQDIKTLGDTY